MPLCPIMTCVPFDRVSVRFIRRLKPSVDKLTPVEQLPTVSVWPLKKREELHKAHALWLVRSKRAFTLPEDNEYRASCGSVLSRVPTQPVCDVSIASPVVLCDAHAPGLVQQLHRGFCCGCAAL